MFVSRTTAVWVSALLLLAGGTITALGASPPRGAYGQGSSGTNNGRQQQLAAAQSELSAAQATLDHLKERAERSLAATPAWSKAKAAVVQAEKNKRAVHDQVTSRVTTTPEYQALAQHSDAAKSDTERADGQAKMATMAWQALDASPEWAKAKADLDKANADVAAQWKAYETSVLSHDPAWTNALAARDAARAKVSAALRNSTGIPGQNSAMTRSSGHRSSRNSYGSSNSSSRSSRYSSSSRYR